MADRRRNNNPQNTPTRSSRSPITTESGSSSGRHPLYHGIRCRAGKWVSEIREPNKSTRIWLGTYPTPEMAAAAYDVATLALKGQQATLNFPESALSYTLPESPTADDIRAAAARAAAARATRNTESGGGSGSTTARETGPPGEYMDDEAVFGMPNLMRDMAEGMLLSPPRTDSSPPEDWPDDGSASGGGNLWSYD